MVAVTDQSVNGGVGDVEGATIRIGAGIAARVNGLLAAARALELAVGNDACR